MGKRPLEAAAAVIQDYGLACTPLELNLEVLELLQERWKNARTLPGAVRLIKHFYSHGIPMAIASSSPARNIKIKLCHQEGWTEYFPVVVAGDMVENGKPAPDIFLEAASRLNVEPIKCLVIEDAPAGVLAAKAAGMQVVAVPSIPSKDARPQYSSADVIYSSLLDFQPEVWGFPSLNDRIGGAIPIEPWYMGGPVIKGFGRGSKLLGTPTANLPTSAFSNHLASHVCGIYIGWAGLANRGVYKMVMSVGWNPYFDNKEKAVEPWILHDFSEDFYGEELRLIVVGYVRPEANFTTLEDLVERIHEDGRVAKAALDMNPFSDYAEDSYLTTPLPVSMSSN
ncbi:bifunctional riboflavin kinase/FMN phosphatase isoform X2 [Physcomitrium patens]|nr:bifunctional riboflavin kinase/FMN phosphatase-like isoform X2 [Physcomitrium patens]|eukprot:XP_024394974.1 bifunctional riboflavin kinase/FMN phosphatase-like isoform X2 [Physcomitrella patens]